MCIELLLSCVYVVFFFKQKTAYEMRISDWSSDVCSSDLLDTFTDTTPEMLAALTMPTLVVCGEQDRDNGSAEELVAALPDARPATIPVTHMSSVIEPELGEAIGHLDRHSAVKGKSVAAGVDLGGCRCIHIKLTTQHHKY